MLKLSKKTEYALIALLDLGERNNLNVVTTKEMAEQYNIPYDILGKVLQVLSKKEIIRSVQGVKGGYMMMRPLKEISLQQVIEAVDGPISLTSCISSGHLACQQHPNCTIRTPIVLIQNDLNDYFKGISLENLASRYHSFTNEQKVAIK